MSDFKTVSFTVKTYDEEGCTSILDWPGIFLTRLKAALLSTSSNWTVVNDVTRYLENATTTDYGAISTMQLKNTQTGKYFRFWWFGSGYNYATSASGAYNMELKYKHVLTNTAKPNNYENTNYIPLNINNVANRKGYYYSSAPNSAAYLSFTPGGLAIGVSSNEISDNLGENLGLDIPLFGFMTNAESYSNSLTWFSNTNYILQNATLGYAYHSSYYKYRTPDYSTRGINKITVSSDGESLWISDKINLKSENTTFDHYSVLYSPKLFENFDSSDLRTDGAYSVCSFGYYQQENYNVSNFISFVDKNGNKIPDYCFYKMDVKQPMVTQKQLSEKIVYTACIPKLIKNYYSNETTLGSEFISKGKISTDYIRIVDENIVKAGNTLSNESWYCPCDGVLFPNK